MDNNWALIERNLNRLDDILIKECNLDPSSSGYLKIHSIIHQIMQIIIKS